MHIRFTCKCGARLRCSVRGIGQVLPCPGCLTKVPVPAPESKEVRRALKEVPHVLPGKSGTEYLGLAKQIFLDAVFNVDLCKVTRHPDIANESVGQAKRTLRNIAVFIDDSVPVQMPQTATAEIAIVNALASVAAGHNFAGFGTARDRARDHKIWQEMLIPNENSKDLHGKQDSLRSQILAVLSAVESLRLSQ
jgi:hypothetical protein